MRVTAQMLSIAERLYGGPAGLRVIRNSKITSALYRNIVGYNRIFPTRTAAEAAIEAYWNSGHENIDNVHYHLASSYGAVPSDYAALFHLHPIASSLSKIYDLGGNVGNLYYKYTKYISLPDNLIWTVQDLPKNMEIGRKLAADRGEHHLHFSTDWSQASGCDLLIVSGALHYFDEPLAAMVLRLPYRPRKILINRSPFTIGTPYFVVQDVGSYLVTCRINNLEETWMSLQELGYRLVDEWAALEFRISVPGDPDHSIPHYSGFFMEYVS